MQEYSQIVAEASQTERADFYKRTYLHVAMAILGFMVLESFLIKYLPASFIEFMFGGKMLWLFIIGLFWLGSMLSNKLAFSTNRQTQYLGLGLYIIIEALIFLPMIYMAAAYSGAEVIIQAAIVTLSLFGGLTALVFMSSYDFSFLRTGLVIGGFISLGLVVAGAIFGFNLGLWFSVGMVVLAGGSILYQTSQIKDNYTTDMYVGAAMQLFASVMLLFWYILRIFMRRD
jgi:FtsH-binding integral membrane protein